MHAKTRLYNRAVRLQAARKTCGNRMCVESTVASLTAFGGPRETVAPQSFQEGTNYR